MNSDPNVVCPNCGAILPAPGLAPGVLVQCSQCGKQFNLGGGSTVISEPATSGKAVISLVLGLIPMPLLTGIPAIILGIWALIDIKRRAGQLRGSGMAVCGILFGSLCTFVCTPFLVFATWFASDVIQQANFTDDPEEAATIAAKIAEFDVPEGVEPIGAGGIIGFQMAIYGDRPNNPSTMIMLMKFPAWMAGSQQQMEQHMQQQMQMQQQRGIDVEESRIVTYTIRGQPVQVNVGIGKDPQSGASARQYMAMIAGQSGPTMVLLVTKDPPESEAEMPEMEDTAVRLTEEQVKEFFESIK
jgi:hypothetical protein